MNCDYCLDSGFDNVGPTGEPRCPKCRNSLQNGIPEGSPNARRCASCKCIWTPKPCPECQPSDKARLVQLTLAVRKLRDTWVRGDDKCWKDLVELFQVLPEGFTPPASDTLVELANCEKYIKSCHHPDTVYVSPQRRIEELEAENARLKQELLIREVERGPIK